MRAMLFLMFVPAGRANRVAFLAGLGAFWLAMPLLLLVLQMVGGTFLLMQPRNLPMIPSLNVILFAWVLLCLFANRLHDIGRSAFWAILPAFLPTLVMGAIGGFSQTALGWGQILTLFVGPVLYMAFAVLLLFFRGSDAPNQFGERPMIA